MPHYPVRSMGYTQSDCNWTSYGRLYCDHAESEGRRSGQTVMYHILEIITKAVAPVLPHLAEEVYQYKPFNTGIFIS